MEVDPTRMCGLLVGLPDVVVLGVVDDGEGVPLRVYVEMRNGSRACAGCAEPSGVKERPEVELVDLPVFGRQARLVWRKHRLVCRQADCAVVSWTVENPAIAAPRLALMDRAGRWVTEQVGRCGRTVNEVAIELGCDWHTVNDAVIAYGSVLVDNPARIGQPTALGLDETLFCRRGPWRHQSWSRSIVDVGSGRLLDVVAGRSAAEPCRWLAAREESWAQGHSLGDLGPVGSLSVGVRHDVAPRHPGRRSVPSPEAGQRQARSVPAAGLGRTIVRWKEQIPPWHRAHLTNGPTEAANNLIKRIKRVAFGLTSFRNHRIRVLLYAGRPNWGLLATLSPC